MKARVIWFAIVMIMISACYSTPLTTKDISTGNVVNAEKPNSESGIPYVVATNAALPVDERIYYVEGRLLLV